MRSTCIRTSVSEMKKNSHILLSTFHKAINCHLNIMVEDIDPHIIGITESWANTGITDAELGLTGYVMFRRDRIC